MRASDWLTESACEVPRRDGKELSPGSADRPKGQGREKAGGAAGSAGPRAAARTRFTPGPGETIQLLRQTEAEAATVARIFCKISALGSPGKTGKGKAGVQVQVPERSWSSAFSPPTAVG